MNIDLVKVDRITPYENNPRNNKKAIDAVAKSLKEFGFQQPIVADENGIIIVGHTRYEATKKPLNKKQKAGLKSRGIRR